MKKIISLLCLFTIIFCASSALADDQKSKQIYYNVPIYNENDEAYMTRSMNVDTLYYQFISDTVCRASMRRGVVLGISVGFRDATVRFTSYHPIGYCPSWSTPYLTLTILTLLILRLILPGKHVPISICAI